GCSRWRRVCSPISMGGADAVGVLGFASMGASGVVGPLLAVVVDRFARWWVVVTVVVVGACALVLAEAVAWAGGLIGLGACPLVRPIHGGGSPAPRPGGGQLWVTNGFWC